MERFLEKLATRLLDKYGEEISGLWIVFPNRRSALFFRHYLSQRIRQPGWSPNFLSISDLMKDFSGLQLADPLQLNLELYEVFVKHRNSKESFDDFYSWGEILLSDFNDLDKYLVPADDLFRNLHAVREIDYKFDYLSPEQKQAIRWFWGSFNPGGLSENQEEFISLWSVLGAVYHDFRQSLARRGLAYEGMCYRQTAGLIRQGRAPEPAVKKIIFAGFCALGKAEHILFEHLHNQGMAEFYWDYDTHYVSNANHEAGYFIRENLSRYPAAELDLSFDCIRDTGKKVRLISASSGIGQAKYINEILSSMKLPGTAGPDQTCVVLPDESLLLPVLNSIPAQIETINVSMGYPLRFTMACTLIDLLLEMYSNARKKDGEILSFGAREIKRLLDHPYIASSGLFNTPALQTLLAGSGRLYLKAGELRDHGFYAELPTNMERSEQMAMALGEILYRVFWEYSSVSLAGEGSAGEPEAGNGKLQREFVFRVHLVVERLRNLFREKNIVLRIDTFLRLVRKYLEHEKISFSGEPLAGLQILGILETRLLDFENIILLSMNEGMWPRISSKPSYIPFGLRQGFGLPAIEHQDAIYSYYFYRLFQRAKNVWLLYNSQEGGLQSGELSRYVTQIRHETGLPVIFHTITAEVLKQPAGAIGVSKTPGIMAWLEGYLGTGNGKRYLSPSSVNTYLDCSLKYYFTYVAGIDEPVKATEEFDPARFGNLLHAAICELYRPFEGKTVTTDDLKALMGDKKRIHQSVLGALYAELGIRDEYRKEYTPEGNLLIILEIIKKYIFRIILQDSLLAPVVILSLERPVYTTVTLEDGREIRLGGKIDRVDRIREGIRIIDYKTGMPGYEFPGTASLFARSDPGRNRAAFQVLLYAWIWHRENKPSENLVPGIYFTRDIYRDDFDFHLVTGKEKNRLTTVDGLVGETGDHLGQVLREIMDPVTPFSQAQDANICRNCRYASICHRS